MTLLQKIKQRVQLWLTNAKKNLPSILVEGATMGLKWTSIFEKWLESNRATEIETLVPDAEPFREEILAILKELDVAFSAIIDSKLNKGTLFIAAGQIGQIHTGEDVPLSHILLAVQAQYVDDNQETAA